MIINKIKILAIIISLFFLMGQTGCQTSGVKKAGERVYSGSEGLTLKFIDGMPPQNVWKDTEFDIGIDVQNKGLVDVKNGRVCFSSFSEKVFSKSDGCQDIGELKGRLDFPDGEIKSYTWDGYNLKESYKEDSEYPLTAKVCYEEETRASPIVCVKSMSYDTKSVCEGGEISLGAGKSGQVSLGSLGGGKSQTGQGAPVAVTSIYEDIIPKKGEGVDLRLNIKVSNIGNGEVIELDKLSKENCNFGRLDKNKVKIEAALTGYETLDCKEGVISLGSDGKEGTILCKTKQPIAIEEGDSYPLPLNIKLNYGYLSTVSGGFTIKKDINEEA